MLHFKRFSVDLNQFFGAIGFFIIIAFFAYCVICAVDIIIGGADLIMSQNFYNAIENFYTIM